MISIRNIFAQSINFALCTIVALSCGLVQASDDAEQVGQAFLKHVDQLEAIENATRQQAANAVKEYLVDSPADAITEGLIVLYPKYGAAIDMADTDKMVQSLLPLAQSQDAYLAADASFYLARTLMNQEDFESALPILRRLTGDLGESSAHTSSAEFYIGVALAGLLKNREAIVAFGNFLEVNPDAPERLRVSAWRQIQQLQKVRDGELTDVYQRMDFSRRRLQLEAAGEVTQEQQQNIVKMLGKLIKEQEKKDCSGCKGNSKNTQKQKQQQQQQAKKKSQQKSSQKTGGKSNNANGQVVDQSFSDEASSPWSRLRDRSRDPANNAVKERLPARYREIVERYYEAVNRDGDR